MQLDWPSFCPAKAVLRREIDAMCEAWVEVLVGALPPSAVRGIYLKGSASKPWDSLIDYVPELSDLDIHLLLTRDADVALLDDLPAALQVRGDIEHAFASRAATPVHVPRPQLTLLNRLMAEDWYVPSPASTVKTLHGEPYPSHEFTPAERAAEVARDRRHLIQFTGAGAEADDFLDRLPLRAIDSPGDFAVTYIRQLAWRVSPIGPRVLSVLGMSIEDAWSLNRTGIVRALHAHPDLAQAYADFYSSGWRHFVSGSSNAIARCISSAAHALSLSAKLAV